MFIFGGIDFLWRGNSTKIDDMRRVNDVYSMFLGVTSLQELAFSTFLRHSNLKELMSYFQEDFKTKLGIQIHQKDSRRSNIKFLAENESLIGH